MNSYYIILQYISFKEYQRQIQMFLLLCKHQIENNEGAHSPTYFKIFNTTTVLSCHLSFIVFNLDHHGNFYHTIFFYLSGLSL